MDLKKAKNDRSDDESGLSSMPGILKCQSDQPKVIWKQCKRNKSLNINTKDVIIQCRRNI